MPFGLKNIATTYKRMAIAMFHDMIYKELEVYIDDMIVKLKTREGPPTDLKKFLKRVKRYSLILNLKKCIFGVTSDKILGYIIS